MKHLSKIIHVIQAALTLFLALTAFLGGIGLLAGLNAPPIEQLAGTPFKDWIIPGLSLFLIVGGSALFASILLLRRSKFASLFSTTAGVIIMFFEFVEVMAIGSPAGIAQTLQIFYYGLGTAIVIASMGAWFIDMKANY